MNISFLLVGSQSESDAPADSPDKKVKRSPVTSPQSEIVETVGSKTMPRSRRRTSSRHSDRHEKAAEDRSRDRKDRRSSGRIARGKDLWEEGEIEEDRDDQVEKNKQNDKDDSIQNKKENNQDNSEENEIKEQLKKNENKKHDDNDDQPPTPAEDKPGITKETKIIRSKSSEKRDVLQNQPVVKSDVKESEFKGDPKVALGEGPREEKQNKNRKSLDSKTAIKDVKENDEALADKSPKTDFRSVQKEKTNDTTKGNTCNIYCK